MNSLKPCPFCGSEVEIKSSITGAHNLRFFYCKECGAVVSFDDGYYFYHQDEVENAWNRRDVG